MRRIYVSIKEWEEWGRSGEEIYEERKSARTKATRPLGPRAGVAASTVLSGVTVGTGVEQLLSCTTPHDVDSHGVYLNAESMFAQPSKDQPRSWSKYLGGAVAGSQPEQENIHLLCNQICNPWLRCNIASK